MLSDEISTFFAEALGNSDPISGQPTDLQLAELRELLNQILLIITYDKENAIHNLFGLIQDPKMYTTDYTAAFPRPKTPGIYNVSIRDNKKVPVQNKEGSHSQGPHPRLHHL